MKSTGIVRKLDPLGRVVLPKDIRREMLLDYGDPVEVYTNGDTIVLKKYQPGCKLCGAMEDLMQVDDSRVCRCCAQKLAAQIKE